MAQPAQINTYINNHYDGMSPEKLILMLFKGALDRLKLVKEGMKENNIQKRGENLSKVIAIVSELNSSLDSKMNDESTQFLRGLYHAILTELPKASINNDISIITRTESYLSKLTEIWETDVMGRGQSLKKKRVLKPLAKSFGGYPMGAGTSALGSITV
jgi:flagellar secretion chaperone FliS